jgi:FkbM family methyltransferase
VFSQHGEDETIARLLGDCKDNFYIDVGAHSPTHESVTLYFYELGWSGINIEPQTNRYNELVEARDRDINLNIAIGSKAGFLSLYLGDGLTTAMEKFASSDWPQIQVPMLTLKEVCETFVKNKPIGFLKVDCEGFEREVILGADWNTYRPKVLCIESTIPMSQIENHQEWEPLVIDANYTFVCKDAVNRFYLRNE